MINKILGVVVNLVLLGNIFYLVWVDKFSSIIIFLVTLLVIWRLHVVNTEKLFLTCSSILQYIIFPFVYLVSYTQTMQSKIIIAALYLPVVIKLVPGIMETLFYESVTEGGKEIKINEESNYYANLLYLYATPILLFQDVKIAYGILGVYALIFIFGLEKYILRQIPIWERVLHITGLSSVLLLLSFSF